MSALATVVVRAASADDRALRPTLESIAALAPRAELEVIVGESVDLDRAGGEWITTLRPGEHLLPEWIEALAANPEADVVYGDALVGPEGRRRRRPAWSPALWDALAYFDSGAAVRRDLLPRGLVRGEDVVHEGVLRSAAIRHVDRATVAVLESEAAVRAAPPSPRSAARASIVVPTRDRLDLLRPCLESVARSAGQPHEVLIVDNESREPETLRYLESAPASVVRAPGAFDFAAMNNAAARRASGDVLVFLNNDTVAEHPGWLAELVGLALEPTVGAVGASLVFPDRTVQHAGILVHRGARVDHVFSGVAPRAIDHPWALRAPHEVAAVTAACLAIRRDLFLRIGGFDESLRVAFNDVDLCFRLRARGYRVVWTPRAEIVHHECATRDPTPPLADEVLFRARWAGSPLDGDPYLEPVRRDLGDPLALPRGEYRRPGLD